jgi:formylmethanofuran dehydrogenase subunit B
VAELKHVEFDDATENAIELLADAIFPHTMDRDQKRRVDQALRRFLQVAWRGPIQ